MTEMPNMTLVQQLGMSIFRVFCDSMHYIFSMAHKSKSPAQPDVKMHAMINAIDLILILH